MTSSGRVRMRVVNRRVVALGVTLAVAGEARAEPATDGLASDAISESPSQEPAGDAADAAAPVEPAAPGVEGPRPPPVSPQPEPPRRGKGLMIAGGIVTAGFLVLLVYGSVRVARAPDFDGRVVEGTRYLLPAICVAAVGVPMLGIGAELWVQRKQFVGAPTRWRPQLARTAHGTWTGGVALGF